VGVAVVLFELLQLVRVFLDYLRIEYLWHALIMPLTNRNGIILEVVTSGSVGRYVSWPIRLI
jgi:hypothetical protein